MQTYSFLHCNVKNKIFSESILRHFSFNEYLNFSWDFSNEDIVYYYVNYVKSLTQKIEQIPLEIFYSQTALDFPLIRKISVLYNYKENLVKTTVFNIFLSILKRNIKRTKCLAICVGFNQRTIRFFF